MELLRLNQPAVYAVDRKSVTLTESHRSEAGASAEDGRCTQPDVWTEVRELRNILHEVRATVAVPTAEPQDLRPISRG